MFPIITVTALSVNISAIWGKVWPVLFAILFFGVIIALHEFGHFITAKLFGIQVNEYSIGMGPAILKRKKGETQYSWRLFPIGGFVSMEGEDEESENPRAFNNQKAWKRFIVVAAGATLNIILGLLLTGIMLGADGDMPTRTVSDVSDQMLAVEDGIRAGDEVLRINNTKVYSARDLYYDLYRETDGVYDIVVRRDGKKITLNDLPVTYSAEEGFCDFIVGYKPTNILNIFPGAVTQTASMMKLVGLSLIDMVRGRYGLKDLSGPVGTIGIVAETASDALKESNYSGIIFILAFITVNIGIVNLLPLPALDGGRLLFIFIEIVFRKPVPKKFEAWVHAAGFVLLIGLMVLITFNDILNLIRK
ncbi:MAG: site-2 protease family protein [Clostridia bacterium]|nr:site-2 protease family protein [Clostridia bacterium]